MDVAAVDSDVRAEGLDGCAGSGLDSRRASLRVAVGCSSQGTKPAGEVGVVDADVAVDGWEPAAEPVTLRLVVRVPALEA